MNRRVSFVLMGLAGSAAAQVEVFVPPHVATGEGIASGQIAGFDARARQQILVDAGLLSPLQGKSLIEIWFRRDLSFGEPFSAATAQVRVILSHAARGSQEPSPSFAANRGPAPVVAFDGVVALPATLAVQQPVPWDSAHTVRIPLSVPFLCDGSPLCIEVEGEPALPNGPHWWVDYEYDGTPGNVTRFGQGCGAATAESTITADAAPRNLAGGGTVEFITWGQPSTPSLLLLGVLEIPAGLEFDPVRAPGCRLYVQPMVSIAAAHAPAGGSLAFPPAQVQVTLPRTAALLGASFVSQCANLEVGPARSNSLGVTTSNALRLQVAPVLPSSQLSTVVGDRVASGQPFPSHGHVDVSRGPAMKLVAR